MCFFPHFLWRLFMITQIMSCPTGLQLDTNHIFSRNYHQVLVLLLRLRQICSHPSLIQEGGVTFVDPNEAHVNPEFATELTRACRLVSSEFVDKLKRNLRRLRWCAFKLRKRYVFWMGLNKHKLMYIPVRPRYHRGRRLSNMLRCHDGYGTRPGSRSIHGEGKDPCHVIAPQMRRSVLKSFLELSLIWPTWLLGVRLNLTHQQCHFAWSRVVASSWIASLRPCAQSRSNEEGPHSACCCSWYGWGPNFEDAGKKGITLVSCSWEHFFICYF